MPLTSSPLALTSPIKRKSSAFEQDNDNSENIDPVIFLSPKRSKCPDGSSKDTSSFTKPTNYFLTPAPPSPPTTFSKPSVSPRRPVLAARSQIQKLDTSRSTPLSAPAGRSPTRKRIGILNRRKTASPFTRVDPPKFQTPSSSSASSLGFSIDAALSGTIPSYSARQKIAAELKALPSLLGEKETKESWNFEIYEDTEEELATNLMEHSTCTLDISSDEESAARERDMRGKENVPPPDDVSQTRTQLSNPVAQTEAEMGALKARARATRRKRDEGAIEIDRCPLGDLAAEDFYAEGCDGESVFVISETDVEDLEVEANDPEVPSSLTFDFSAEIKGKGKEREIDIDELMRKDDREAPKAAKVLEPIEKAEDGFEVWESGSAQGDE